MKRLFALIAAVLLVFGSLAMVGCGEIEEDFEEMEEEEIEM